jgi:hypothetical protein
MKSWTITFRLSDGRVKGIGFWYRACREQILDCGQASLTDPIQTYFRQTFNELGVIQDPEFDGFIDQSILPGIQFKEQ